MVPMPSIASPSHKELNHELLLLAAALAALLIFAAVSALEDGNRFVPASNNWNVTVAVWSSSLTNSWLTSGPELAEHPTKDAQIHQEVLKR